MQRCDQTCHHCARHWFTWWASRHAPRKGARAERSGRGDFYAEAVTSRDKTQAPLAGKETR